MLLMEATDIAIIIVIHLFVLSLINEKFTNFLKLNLQSLYESNRDFWILKLFLWRQSWRKKFKKFLKKNLKNLREHESDQNKEKLRERGIINLTIFCGIITATFAGADLFYLLKNAKSHTVLLLNWTGFFNKLSWECPIDSLRLIGNAILNHGFGFIFSGLFLSLGSKFWHDLLDVLFQAKNMKSKLKDSRTFDTESVDEVQEFIFTSNSQLRRLALTQNSKLFDNDDILYTTHSDRIINGRSIDCIAVFVKDNSNIILPDKVKVKLAKSGFETYVPVIKYEINDIPKVNFGQGSLMRVDEDFAGSSCCLVRLKERKDIFLLTCCHNFTNGTLNTLFDGWQKKDVEVIEVEEDDENIGVVDFAQIDKTYDIALVNITEKIEDYNPRVIIKKIGQENEYYLGKKAFFSGFKTNGNAFGYVTAIFNAENEIPIEYSDGRINKMTNLIEFSTTADSHGFSPSKSGDSGGLIYDENKQAIAMILAGSNRHSYAIPIHLIAQRLNAELFIK